MVAGVQPVSIHGAEVLNVQLEQAAGELGSVTKLLRERISLKLKLARNDVHEVLDDSVHGRQGAGEEDEPDDDGELLVEAVSIVQGLVVDEDREESEDVENVDLEIISLSEQITTSGATYLRNAHEAGQVAKLPMTKFVTKHSNNLLGLALLKKSVVDDNVLLPRQAVEVGVGVCAALAAIDNVELGQWELEAASECLDLGFELAVLEGRKLVEQRKNDSGVHGHHENLNGSGESPEVEEEAVAGLLDNLQETGQQWGREDKGEQVGLDHIGDEETRRLLVEAELLFQNECMIDATGETEGLVDQNEADDEEDGVANLAREARRRPLQQEITSPGPEFWQHVVLDESDVTDLRPEAIEQLVLGLGATVGLRLVEDILRNFLGENLGRGLGLKNAILTEGEEGLEEVLADVEADDELLPREQRAVEEPSEALRVGVSTLNSCDTKSISILTRKSDVETYLKEIHLVQPAQFETGGDGANGVEG